MKVETRSGLSDPGQRMPGTARTHQKLGEAMKDSPLEPPLEPAEGAGPCWHLISGFQPLKW